MSREQREKITDRQRFQIAVIGGREVTQTTLEKAEEAGRAIAERGAILLCGGLGGVMEAACRGAKSVGAGSTTVGILPTLSRQDANAYVDVAIPTNMGVARNAILIQAADAAVAVGGSYGTLSEMAFALQKEIPLASIDSWKVDETVQRFETGEEAVVWIFEQLKTGRNVAG